MCWLPLAQGLVHRSLYSGFNDASQLSFPGGWTGMDRHKQCASYRRGKSIRSLKRVCFLKTLEVIESS